MGKTMQTTDQTRQGIEQQLEIMNNEIERLNSAKDELLAQMSQHEEYTSGSGRSFHETQDGVDYSGGDEDHEASYKPSSSTYTHRKRQHIADEDDDDDDDDEVDPSYASTSTDTSHVGKRRHLILSEDEAEQEEDEEAGEVEEDSEDSDDDDDYYYDRDDGMEDEEDVEGEEEEDRRNRNQNDALADRIPIPDSPESLDEDEKRQFRHILDNDPKFRICAPLFHQLVDFAILRLRDYQLVAVCRAFKAFLHAENGAAVSIVLPTGTGKSHVIYHLSIMFRLLGLKTLVVQPNLTLIRSMVPEINELISSIRPADLSRSIDLQEEDDRQTLVLVSQLMKGGKLKRNDQILVDTLQTDAGKSLLENAWFLVVNYQKLYEKGASVKGVHSRFKPDIILVDEAHHIAAETYQKLLKVLDSAKFRVYLSACLQRYDGVVVEDPIYKQPTLLYFKNIPWAIEKGYVKRRTVLKVVFDKIKIQEVITDEAGYEKVGEEAMYCREDLEEGDHPLLRKIFNIPNSPTIKFFYEIMVCRTLAVLRNHRKTSSAIGREKGLVPAGIKHVALAIAPHVRAAKLIANLFKMQSFKRYKPDGSYKSIPVRAEVLHHKMHPLQRDEVIEKYDNHEIDVVVQVKMLNEGYSNNNISVVTFFSPINSWTQVLQLEGRGGRLIRRTLDDGRQIVISEENQLRILTANFHQMDDVFRKIGLPVQAVHYDIHVKQNTKQTKKKKKKGNSGGSGGGRPEFSLMITGFHGDDGVEAYDLTMAPIVLPRKDRNLLSQIGAVDIVNNYHDHPIPRAHRRRYTVDEQPSFSETLDASFQSFSEEKKERLLKLAFAMESEADEEEGGNRKKKVSKKAIKKNVTKKMTANAMKKAKRPSKKGKEKA